MDVGDTPVVPDDGDGPGLALPPGRVGRAGTGLGGLAEGDGGKGKRQQQGQQADHGFTLEGAGKPECSGFLMPTRRRRTRARHAGCGAHAD